ncbi:MAG: sulfite exporter TauE/SafE family protein [Alphaproteobacteria bacterium]|nr:sulfite exporter TauE/SafE family protein [Alphaproteobacteria bacterium]
MIPVHAAGLLYPISGFAVGVLVGMTGIGGGSLMTPLLILLFGVSPATAVGTDLLVAAATKTAGTAVHGFTGTVDWRIVGRLAAGSMPTTALTLFALSRLDLASPVAHHLITVVLGCALFTSAFVLIFRGRIMARYGERFAALAPQRRFWLTVATGATLGVLVPISSVGAGALGATALLLLYPRLPVARIVGSDIAHAVPLTLIAGIGHWALGSINWDLLGALLLGSLPGIVAGSYAATRVPDAALRLVLAVTLIAAGGRLIF